VQDDGAPELATCPDTGDVLRTAGAQLLEQECVDVFGVNPSGRQLVAIPGLRQVRFASEPRRGVLDRVFE
jgi:hypothetical protein